MSDTTGIPQGASVAQYVSKRWGTKVRLVPRAIVAVATTVTRIAKNNPKRLELHVVNTSVGNVFVGWDTGVAAASDIPLLPGGGSITLLADEDGELTTYDLYGIAPGGPLNVSVWEIESI
jgi:hypothetical protein